MDHLIFDRLAAMRADAEARAERIHQRAMALEARRRELYARMDALGAAPVDREAEPASAGPRIMVSTKSAA